MRRTLSFISMLASLAAFITACASGIDADQARVCRTVIPALNVDAKQIVLEPPTLAHLPNSLRISYQVMAENAEPEGELRRRFVICLFASRGLDERKRELSGLATEEGPLSDAAFYFLRRFYLEDQREPPRDPGPAPTKALAKISPGAAYAVQQVLVALPTAATYALLASAYALIYGLAGRIILAFGEFAALGSLAGVVGVAATLSLEVSTPLLGVFVALGFALFASALHGFAAGRVAISALMARGTGQQVLIGSVGLALAISEYLRIAVGPDRRWLPPVFNEPVQLARATSPAGEFTVTATPVGLAAAALGFAAALGVVLYLKHSAYGRQWRALADDAKAAALCGVNIVAVRDRAFVIACALSGAAGLVVTVLYGGLGFAGGFTLGLKALIGAVLGGIGSVRGAMLGGLALAVFEALWSSYLPIEQRDLAVYSLLALVLILRPGGFFGDAELAPRPV